MENNLLETKELEILRNSVDYASKVLGKKLAQSDNVKKMIMLLENFLRNNKSLCYGGTAINAILPEQYKFYDKNIDVPDYDFFTPYPIEYSKKIADLYYNNGYTEVEAKSSIHSGTFKIFVNFLPIADITYMDETIFNNLYKRSIKINAISYCPPNFLRMGMYQELSRPMGDVSRWEKILKRLILLNKNFPLRGNFCNYKNFQRKYEEEIYNEDENKVNSIKLYKIVKDCFINQGLIFFGGYAASLYGNYMPKNEKIYTKNIPDFDILSDDPYSSAVILKEQLIYQGFKNIKIILKPPIGKFVENHYEIMINKDIIAIIYKTNACHSYNVITINGRKLKIATIDTILSFYLIFIYANRNYYDENRLLCISEFLFKVQLKNRLKQKGLLRRFTVNCYGKQKSLEDLRSDKSILYNELKDKPNFKNSKEFKFNFFRYIPSSIEFNKKNIKSKSKSKSNKKVKTRKK